jgi:hypothetical protein
VKYAAGLCSPGRHGTPTFARGNLTCEMNRYHETRGVVSSRTRAILDEVQLLELELCQDVSQISQRLHTAKAQSQFEDRSCRPPGAEILLVREVAQKEQESTRHLWLLLHNIAIFDEVFCSSADNGGSSSELLLESEWFVTCSLRNH